MEYPFRDNLRKAIAASGLVVKEVADASEVAKGTIDNWVAETPTTPKVTEAVKVARALKISVEELVDGTRPKGWCPPENIVAIVDDLLSLDEATLKLVAKMIHALVSEQTAEKPVVRVAELERPLVGAQGADKKAKA